MHTARDSGEESEYVPGLLTCSRHLKRESAWWRSHVNQFGKTLGIPPARLLPVWGMSFTTGSSPSGVRLLGGPWFYYIYLLCSRAYRYRRTSLSLYSSSPIERCRTRAALPCPPYKQADPCTSPVLCCALYTFAST